MITSNDRIAQMQLGIRDCSFSGSLRQDQRTMTFTFRSFKCPMRKMIAGFNWGRHIEQSFHECMKPMTDKFMKVV